jgi:hypothetical protein
MRTADMNDLKIKSLCWKGAQLMQTIQLFEVVLASHETPKGPFYKLTRPPTLQELVEQQTIGGPNA